MRGDEERGYFIIERIVRSGGLGRQEKENIRGRAQPQRHYDRSLGGNQKSDRLNIMLGARGRHMNDTREDVIQSRAGKKKESRHWLTVHWILCPQTL